MCHRVSEAIAGNSIFELARSRCDIHTQNIDTYWSNLKGRVHVEIHQVGEEHLLSYFELRIRLLSRIVQSRHRFPE